ncbi:MAG: serine/threonine protein kinase [Rubritalea sp.]|jgi:serine/threonine protein kinase
MPSNNATQTAEKAKKMLAWALTERLDAPRENETIVLPGYSIKETLGKGGMGTVYRAIHTELNRTVALKIFSPKAENKELFVERLKREGKLMAQLKHPNVLAIHDAAVMEDGTPYLVLEYIKGEDLQQKLHNKFTLNQRTAVRIAIKVCEGLSAVHQLGIIHRDIKPANVLLGSNGCVKVTDFGISKDMRTTEQNTSLTMTGTTVGTADYMSPEQTRNEDLSPRSDLYSVGVLLYEMLMGVTPRGNFQSLSKAHIPKKLEYIIMRCLQQDKCKRPASAETLALSLRKIYHLLNNRKHKNYKSLVLCGIAAVLAIAIVTYVSTKASPPRAPEVAISSWKLNGKIGEWSPLTENKPHSQKGEWWADTDSLYTQKNQYSRRFFSFSAGYYYTFSTEFSRVYGEGNMCVFLPTVKGLIAFELDHTDAHLTGFHSLNGKDLTQQVNPNKLAIKTGELYQLEFTVTNTEVTAKINNNLITTLLLKGNSLSTPSHWEKPIPFRLGIGSNGQSIFKNTQVKRIKKDHAK